MDKNFNSNLSLNDNRESAYGNVDGLSLQNLFFARNSYFPSCYMFKGSNKQPDIKVNVEKIFSILREKYGNNEQFEHVQYSYRDFNTNETTKIISVVIGQENIYLRIENYITDCYILYGNDDFDKANEIASIFIENTIEELVEKNNLHMVSQSQNGFSLTKLKIKEFKHFNVETHYNDDFIEEDKKIKEFISNDDQSGLIILHGGKGTGKTTYIRSLILNNPDKKFVFVPSNLIPMLGDPSFANFLLTMTNHIIVLEDCEDAIRSRKVAGNGAAVSLLLNMSDGLMSDDLCMKFICTFNEDIKNIDEALTRKGRLVSKYEFNALDLKKTNALLAKVYEDNNEIPVSDKPLTLADIYNYFDSSYENNKKTVGFAK